MRTRTIYIQLLDEGTIVYRPTLGEELENGIFRVLPTEDYDPEYEIWEFPPGSLVRGEMESLGFYSGPKSVLVATQRIDRTNIHTNIELKDGAESTDE